MVDAQRRFVVDAQRNDRSRAQKPADLTHTGLQLLQLLRLKARAHDAQAVADASADLAVERAVRHGPDGLAEGLDDLPEKTVNPRRRQSLHSLPLAGAH